MDSEFKINETDIPGLLEIELWMLEDDRGYFQEKYQKAKLLKAGFLPSFNPVQHNISFNKKSGVTRGIHAEPWDKYISPINGKIYAVFVDLRKANFGKKVEMFVDSKKAVFVPEGVANSYQALEDGTFYSYLVNDHWSEDKTYKAVNLADPRLAIAWPINLDMATVSAKDKNNPFLDEVEPFNHL